MRRADWAYSGSLDALLTDGERVFWEARLRDVVTVDARGCWLIDARIDRNGYAKWTGPAWDIGGWAHRNAWFIFHGPVPWHLEIDHLCYTQTCVNPEHLELVTPVENKRRKSDRQARTLASLPMVHGTRRGYNRGCDCVKCVEHRPWPLADRGTRVEVVETSPPDIAGDLSGLWSFLHKFEWMDEAACATSAEDLWTRDFVHASGPTMDAARQYCDECPVVGQCIDLALRTQPDIGVWGGVHASKLPSTETPVAVAS